MTHDYSKLWALAPSWARWIATDADGMRCWHKEKPQPHKFRFMHLKMPLSRCQTIDRNVSNSSDWKNSLQEIPERERDLNWLSENVESFPDKAIYVCVGRREPEISPYFETVESADFSAHGHIQSSRFTKEQLQQRRRIRIEAGLIEGEPGNSSETPDSSEDDLTWLARNVDEWKRPHKYLCRIAHGESWAFEFCSTLSDVEMYDAEAYERSEWLQRRRELGLEPDTDNGEGWVPKNDWNEKDLPNIGDYVWINTGSAGDVECVVEGYRIAEALNPEFGCHRVYVRVTYAHDRSIVNQRLLHDVRIETPEQKAERERKTSIKEMCDLCWEKVGSFDSEQMAALYDAGYRLKSEGKVKESDHD